MIQALIFDCFGVLTADKWKEFVATLPAKEQQKAHDLNRTYDCGQINKNAFLQAVQDLTGTSQSALEQTLDNESSKNVQLLEYIKLLQGTYKIGLLSNIASNWIREEFLNKDEQSRFDEYILSYEVGLAKPSPQIFEIAAERLGVPPEACIMIDDVEQYCSVAKEVGMQSICYQNFAQLKTELKDLLSDTEN